MAKRERVIAVRLNEMEYRMVQERAEARGITPAEFVRNQINAHTSEEDRCRR